MTKRAAKVVAQRCSQERGEAMFVVRNRAQGFGVCTAQEIADRHIPASDVAEEVRAPEPEYATASDRG